MKMELKKRYNKEACMSNERLFKSDLSCVIQNILIQLHLTVTSVFYGRKDDVSRETSVNSLTQEKGDALRWQSLIMALLVVSACLSSPKESAQKAMIALFYTLPKKKEKHQ